MSDENLSPKRLESRESIAKKFGPGSKSKCKEKPMVNDLVVIAKNHVEMQAAQEKLIGLADSQLAEELDGLELATENLEIAVKNKWRTKGLRVALVKARKRFEFYEKIKAALEKGYVIVPNFDLDIFAIRTTRTDPKPDMLTSTWRKPTQDEFEQKTDQPKVGEGENVDPWPTLQREVAKVPSENNSDKLVSEYRAWPVDWQAPDFPFKMAKPQILEGTAKAMSHKIFDRIGVTPARSVRKRDPMVIGEIVHTNGASERVMSFLIVWWIDTSDL